MKQVIQNFKTGELKVEDLPAPMVRSGGVLVCNHCSLISAGTERSTVEVAQSNLIGKAQKRPDLVKQTLDSVRREGLVATYDKVMNRLAMLKPLGYSCAGEVVETGCPELFRRGDRVACAGAEFAHHAEYIFVPKNLCVNIPAEVSFEEAAYSTLGAIAMQGVRQANPTIGERIAVIGLGLLGQLTVQILAANGCEVTGIDFAPHLVALAENNGAAACFRRNDPSLERSVHHLTAGEGFDAVIITAATQSNDPIMLSGRIARKKGRIIVVGNVKLEVPRSPFYEKELDVRMSCSYGPGRYDSRYESEGIDYPFGYVRWTEKRNLEAFLRLLATKKVNVKPLTTHRFDIASALEAYKLILGKTNERPLGVLLTYPHRNGKLAARKTFAPSFSAEWRANTRRIGFIGAGNFAQAHLLPQFKKISQARLIGIANANGPSAKNVSDKFGFEYCTTDYREILSEETIDTVFIATRHNSHAPLAVAALRAGKNVFVEKPPVINAEQMYDLASLFQELLQKESGVLPRFAVGYNRRFAPLTAKLKNLFATVPEPMMLNYRVNAGFLERSHWLHDEHVGGGRIIGEACHFIDFAQYFIGGKPVSVYAEALPSSASPALESFSATIRFDEGSVANVCYTANGSSRMPKEHIEVFRGGCSGVIDNFMEAHFFDSTQSQKMKDKGKGYLEEVRAFLSGDDLLPYQQWLYASAITFALLESLRTRSPQEIALP